MGRLLLVGASGRVGRMVAAQWRRAPPGDWCAQYRGAGPEGALIWSPLDGPGPLLAAARHRPFAAMIVLAGPTPDGGQTMEQTVPLALACLAAAGAAGVGRVLLASSSAVYGTPADSDPVTEAAPLRPVSPYGQAKAGMEASARAAAARLNLCCLRIGNVAGADALLTPRGARNGPVILDTWPDGGGPLRSYIGPATLARVLAALARAPAPLPPVLNLAAPVPVAMADLARAASLTIEPRPAPPQAVPRLVLDTAALAALFPFVPADSDPAAMVAQWRALA